MGSTTVLPDRHESDQSEPLCCWRRDQRGKIGHASPNITFCEQPSVRPQELYTVDAAYFAWVRARKRTGGRVRPSSCPIATKARHRAVSCVTNGGRSATPVQTSRAVIYHRNITRSSTLWILRTSPGCAQEKRQATDLSASSCPTGPQS